MNRNRVARLENWLGRHECPDCDRYIAAVARGNEPGAALFLRCERGQETQQQLVSARAGEPDEGAAPPPVPGRLR